MKPPSPHSAALAAALDAIARGWSIIPADPVTKKPLTNPHTGRPMGWAKYRTAPAGEAQARQWFDPDSPPLVAVILGEASGGLVCRDFDGAAGRSAYAAWAKENPGLAKSLPTAKTPDGLHVYFRSTWQGFIDCGDGELRGDSGHYCCLPPGPGRDWIIPLPKGDLPLVDNPVAVFHATPRESLVNACDRLCPPVSACNPLVCSCVTVAEDEDRIQRAIEATLPSGTRQRHKAIFHFARRLKGMDDVKNAAPADLKHLVRAWWKRALPFIQTKDWTETWVDFVEAWDRVQHPADDRQLKDCLARAKARPVAGIENPIMATVAALCRELQIVHGSDPFFLSGYKLAGLLEIEHRKAARWLRHLERGERIIRRVKVYSLEERKAAEYLYIGPE
ncbi:MAG: bifunctional DNA primase/polymerase [Planctomycetaceae bacterium]|nr:bifunctional DNA primase/polymerase [Planctomycetaceae bacterium]